MTVEEQFRAYAIAFGYPLAVASRERVQEQPEAIYENCFTQDAWAAFKAGWDSALTSTVSGKHD